MVCFWDKTCNAVSLGVILSQSTECIFHPPHLLSSIILSAHLPAVITRCLPLPFSFFFEILPYGHFFHHTLKL